MRIVLTGPPGAGKGTLAKALSVQSGSVPISTGDLLRAAVSAGSELGKAAAEFMDRGELVPDHLILGLVEDRLRECSAQGFILDGFPRTIPQAVSLDFILARLGLTLDLVADLSVPAPVIMERLASRGTCTDAAIANRLKVYREQSAPLTGHYQRKGLLLTVRETDPREAAALIIGAVAVQGRIVVQ